MPTPDQSEPRREASSPVPRTPAESPSRRDAPPPPPPPHAPRSAGHPWARRLAALFVALVIIAALAVLAIRILLMTDYPRRSVVSLLEQETGLNVEARTLSTGWAGHSVLHDVVFRLPLDKDPVLTADTVVADHSNLVLLLLGGFRLQALKIDGAAIDAYPNALGQWSLLRAVQAIQRSQPPGPPMRHAANLPIIAITNASLRISKPPHAPVDVPLEFHGAPATALTWEFRCALGDSRVKGRLTPSGWAHQIDATIDGIDPILALWIKSPPRPANASLHWAGRLTSGGVSGQLEIDALNVATVAAHGDTGVSVVGSDLTLAPGTLQIASPMLSQGPLELSRGTVTASAKSVSATHVHAELPGLVAQIAGNWDIDADSAAATFAWSGSLAGQALKHHGQGDIAGVFPQVGRRSIKLDLDATADAGAQQYHTRLTASAAGITWDALDGQLSAPTLVVSGVGGSGEPIDVSGLRLGFTERWPVLTLLDASVPGAEVTRSSAVFNFLTHQWITALDSSGVTVPQLGHERITLSLDAAGDLQHADVKHLVVSTPSVEVAAAGSFTPSRPEPLQAHADLTAHLIAPPPKSSDAAFQNQAKSEAGAPVKVQPAGLIRASMDIAGQVSPTQLHAQGFLHAQNVLVGQETLPPIDVAARATAGADGAELRTDAFPLFGGQWTLGAWYRNQTKDAEAHLDAARVSLNQIVHTLTPKLLIAGDLETHLDARLPDLDYRRFQLDGGWSVGDLTAAGQTFQRGTGGISYQNGRVVLSDINIVGPGDQSALAGQIAFDAADPRHIAVDMITHRWPLAVKDTDLHALLESHAVLDVDAVKLGAEGTLNLTLDSWLQDKSLGTITALSAVHGRTIEVNRLAADILGGTIAGEAHVPLEDWTTSTAHLQIEGIDLGNLGDLARAMGDLRGTIAGTVNIAPSTSPEAFEPLRAEAALTIKNGAQRGMSFGDMSLVAFAGPSRVMLDHSTVRIADGTADLWGRLTWHGAEPFVHVSLQANSLSLDQLVRAADPAIGETPGIVNGRAMFGGYVYQPHRAYGEAEFTLHQADLGRFPVITQLYNLLNLSKSSPQGQGQVQLRLEGDTLQLERLHYYNRGADVVANGTVDNIWRGKDSPVSAIAAAALHPLKDSGLPFGRELDRLLRGVFANAVSVAVSGTLDNRVITVVPLADLKNAINRLFGNTSLED